MSQADNAGFCRRNSDVAPEQDGRRHHFCSELRPTGRAVRLPSSTFMLAPGQRPNPPGDPSLAPVVILLPAVQLTANRLGTRFQRRIRRERTITPEQGPPVRECRALALCALVPHVTGFRHVRQSDRSPRRRLRPAAPPRRADARTMSGPRCVRSASPCSKPMWRCRWSGILSLRCAKRRWARRCCAR